MSDKRSIIEHGVNKIIKTNRLVQPSIDDAILQTELEQKKVLELYASLTERLVTLKISKKRIVDSTLAAERALDASRNDMRKNDSVMAALESYTSALNNSNEAIVSFNDRDVSISPIKNSESNDNDDKKDDNHNNDKNDNDEDNDDDDDESDNDNDNDNSKNEDLII